MEIDREKEEFKATADCVKQKEKKKGDRNQYLYH